MATASLIGLLISAAVLVYLVAALVVPERF